LVQRLFVLAGTAFLILVPNGIIAAASSTANGDAAGAIQYGQRMVDGLKGPEFGASRCMLPIVIQTDSQTVAVSTDRALVSGDVISAIGSENVDPTEKFPVKELLQKHATDETIQVMVKRVGAKVVVSVKCADSKAFYDRILEGGYAASKGDFSTCADKLGGDLGNVPLNFSYRVLLFHCSLLAGRIPNASDRAKGYYDLYRLLILESGWSLDALSNIRATVLTAVDTLNKQNQLLLGSDLKQLYEQAVALRSPSLAK
jgi:hypothetical protein